MAFENLPDDAYPQTTNTGVQIRPDFISPVALTLIPFLAANASVLDTSLVTPLDNVIFYADQDCIIAFIGLATKTPSKALAMLLLAGERASVIIPKSASGISVIGLTANGNLFIQKVVAWAGLANPNSLQTL